MKRNLLRFIANRIYDGAHPSLDPNLSLTSIRKAFRLISDDLPHEAIRDLRRFELLDERGNLNRDAIMRIRIEIARKSK